MIVLPRRRVLIGASGILLAGTTRARALPDEVAALIQGLVGDGTLAKGRVKLDLPQLVENGNAVSMTAEVEDRSDRVISLSVFAERNPLPQVITATFGPNSGRPWLQTHIRLATSQTVIAVAKCADGRCWSDSVDLIVTLAACIE
jgi:sulfur-oxidizing protein SoxY